jgi:hypothetical protein
MTKQPSQLPSHLFECCLRRKVFLEYLPSAPSAMRRRKAGKRLQVELPLRGGGTLTLNLW